MSRGLCMGLVGKRVKVVNQESVMQIIFFPKIYSHSSRSSPSGGGFGWSTCVMFNMTIVSNIHIIPSMR